jgi:hypothetical protein
VVKRFAVDSDDLVNFDLVQSASLGPIDYAHIQNARLRRRLNSFVSNESYRTIVFGQSELLARRLLREYPPNWILRAGSADIVLLGWGECCKDVLIALQKNAHFAFSDAPTIRVFTSQPKRAEAEYLSEYSELNQYYPVAFQFCDSEDPAKLLGALDRCGQASLIYVCHDDSEALFAAVDALVECHLHGPGLEIPAIVLAPQIPPAAGKSIEMLCEASPLVRFFGFGSDMLGDELTILRQLDRLAIAIHEGYVRNRLEEGEMLYSRPAIAPWCELNERYREENRSQGDHHWIKARELGLAPVPLNDKAISRVEDLETLSATAIEAMAKAEHDRWVCSRFSHGWSYSEVRDDSRLKHDNLVTWEALSDQVKGYDRTAVLELPKAFAEAGLALVPLARPERGFEIGKGELPSEISLESPEDLQLAIKIGLIGPETIERKGMSSIFDGFGLLVVDVEKPIEAQLQELTRCWYSSQQKECRQ